MKKEKKKDKKHKCIQCGKDATIFEGDPFTEEIYPEEENPAEWWCEDCYQERLYDI